MTYAEIVLKALTALGEAPQTPRDVMWQVRRDGWQITTTKARNVLRFLSRSGKVEMLHDGPRYFFRTIQPPCVAGEVQ